VRGLAGLALALLAAAASAGASVAASGGVAEALARSAGEADPVLRIGLDASHRVLVASDRPYRIVDAGSGEAVWRESYAGDTAAIGEGGPEGAPPSVFRIQAGAYQTEAAATA